MQLKGSSSKKESKVNSCDSISDYESVGSGDNHARDTPINAAEDVAFGLYRTGTEQLSTESVNRVKPYVVTVQLGRAQINCKMEVDTGASRSTVSKSDVIAVRTVENDIELESSDDSGSRYSYYQAHWT